MDNNIFNKLVSNIHKNVINRLIKIGTIKFYTNLTLYRIKHKTYESLVNRSINELPKVIEILDFIIGSEIHTIPTVMDAICSLSYRSLPLLEYLYENEFEIIFKYIHHCC